jgi:hypothetical protein
LIFFETSGGLWGSYLTKKTNSCLDENQRYAVYEILLKCFGNENLLFNSLWLATHVAEDQDNDEDQDNRNESANDPFWPLTSDRMAAYAWTSEGCCRRY